MELLERTQRRTVHRPNWPRAAAVELQSGDDKGDRKMARKSTGRPATAAGSTVAVWEQDPGDGDSPDGGQLVSVPAPDLAAGPLALAIQEQAPPPQVYQKGTPQFRYWAAAAAGRRGADFWSGILPRGTNWHSTVGTELTLRLDEGEDINAFYDRTGLSFFHATVANRTVFSGESPDVLCHEMGHAILDSIRPQLWNVANFEVPAFHESFGDMSAILTALQVPSLRAEVLADTSGTLYRNSRLSRLAEQLGWAIRQDHPTDVEPDSLRNAVNSLAYQDPTRLPRFAPASSLSREPHSLSRVFTAGFFEGMGGMLKVIAGARMPTEADLLQASQDIATILITAIVQTPVVTAYFSQVAAHMVAVAAAQPGNRYGDALKSAFVRHGILSLQSAVMITAARATEAGVAATLTAIAAPDEMPMTPISVADAGLQIDTILVQVASDAPRFEASGAAPDSSGPIITPAPDEAAKAFVDDLLHRGHLELGEYGIEQMAVYHPTASKTHVLAKEGNNVCLYRSRIDCGLGSGKG